VIPLSNPAKKQGDALCRDRRLSVVVFALFFSWLLAFPFEGRVLYAITNYHGVSAHQFVFGAMAAHFAGLLACGFFVKNMRTAKKLILFSIAFCAAATGVFFLPPSFLWAAALFLAAFLVGACVAAWGFYFKGCTPKDERIKTMADGLIFSNLLMILLNMAAIHLSAQIALGFSIAFLAAAFLTALKLPKRGAEGSSASAATDADVPVSPSTPGQGAVPVSKSGALAFLCLFIVVITINSGLMYQVVSPAFARLEWLTSWYWAVPYIAALFVMRNLSGRFNRSYILYVAIAMLGISFILFIVLGRLWTDYLLINTLMLGACGVYDLFWWSILGDMLEYDKNPAKIIGTGLAANVLGVLLGGLIGNAITAANGQTQSHTLLAFGVVCATFILLPPLSNRLTRLLKSNIYLPALAETPVQEQIGMINELDLAEPLTARESEVMRLLLSGKSYKVIAAELYITEKTVGSHASKIYLKAGVTNRAELMNLFLKPPSQ